MDEILCFDSYGNTIDVLTQWDTNLELYINWEYESEPIFHFSNIYNKRILVVNGSKQENNMAKVNIPNILLQDASPLVIYVYLEQSSDNGSYTGKTVYTFKVPVHEKAKPEDYEYFENTEYISWVQLKADMETQVKNLVVRGTQSVEGYENSLTQIKTIRDEVKSLDENVTSTFNNISVISSTVDANAKFAENSMKEATSQATTATSQANIAISKAKSAEESANEVATNLVLTQEYMEKAKKYAEQSREASDIMQLESRVSELEEELKAIKDNLGI